MHMEESYDMLLPRGSFVFTADDAFNPFLLICLSFFSLLVLAKIKYFDVSR